MKSLTLIAITLLLVGAHASAQSAPEVKVTHASAQPSTIGPKQNFTGTVRVDSRFQATSPGRVGGGTVTFEPGARTAWHTHPLGQTLIVTSGAGWVQQWGQAPQAMQPGDIVWIPPGVKHWHGASADTGLSHIAIAEALDGKTVEWMEHVSHDQYPQTATSSTPVK
ncbi:cupin domain-containing protein [Pseudomonas rhodesiae]|jgi:quercetin dioxygenase-like cupin family protein|uniref:Cupin domain-containing protein n=1 Tax=Pseudomonas rhodesiae TaxID=76760 RepID=A0A8I1E5Y4_9PSED|nr:cupin domain-containing protein [Pseudomonas rhodesiae]MBI6626231.1 cupin domain-containing protein [Pseudomonas rhodesiae]